MAIEINDLNSIQDEGIILDGLMNVPLIKGDKGDKGDTGEQGVPNQLTIGTVETGEEASATIEGEAPNQTLNLILPKGDKGDTGDSGYDDTEIRDIIAEKVDKIEGKVLSSNDFTDELKQKLDDIGEGSFLPTGGTTGQVLAKASDVDGDVEWVEQSGGSGIATTSENILPVGSVVEWHSDTIPEDWLLCNGQAVSRTDYADLFNILGTKYGTGNGSTTFNLPNLQGKVPVGKDSNDTEFNTLGKTGGEKAHTLTVAEMARHNHDFIDNNSGITKTIAAMKNGGSNELSQTSGSKHYDYFYVNYTGESKPHNNLQPYAVCNFIIKAKQSIVGGATGKTIINKTNVDVIMATLSANQNINTTEQWQGIKIEFDEINNNDFTLQNGGIKIGKGITKIEVSGHITLSTAITGRGQIFVRKNGNTIGKIGHKYQNEDYYNISLIEQSFNVVEGDVITLHIVFENIIDNKIIRQDSTYMTIVAIKDETEYLTSEENTKLLWENPNPKAEFAGQTIQLSEDIENYKYYEIIYYINTDGKRIKSTGLLTIETAMLDLSMHYNVIRTVSEINGTNLTFSDGVHYKTYGTSTTTVSNAYIIPYKIIGYKDNNLLMRKEEIRVTTGEEFVTNEYIDGKRVYRKIINLGAGPNNNSKSYAIGVEASKIVKLNVNMKNEIVYIPLGFVNTSTTQMITYYVNETNLVIQAGMDRSDYNVIVEIYYTK